MGEGDETMPARARGLAAAAMLAAATATAGVPLGRTEPAASAPAGLMQFGRLVGAWTCTGQARQPDGGWKQAPGRHAWHWYYVLDGHAVADAWRPDREAQPDAAEGINLRTYDPASDQWDIAWATRTQPRLDRFKGAERDGEMHLFAERAGSGGFGPHLMRITFFNIGPRHFDWKYEASAVTDGKRWREVQRLSCDRDA